MEQIKPLMQNNDYHSWVKELKQRYLSARLKASVEANRILLEYYWSIGCDIAQRHYANSYGSAFYETLSRDLRSELPDAKGFSVTNLKYMHYFYQLYSQLTENRPQGVNDSIFQEACSIPWLHQRDCKLEVPKCHLKLEQSKTSSVCFY